jgi:hypothetical protein
VGRGDRGGPADQALLIRSQRIKGVNTGDHPTTEVGDMIANALRKPAVVKV